MTELEAYEKYRNLVGLLAIRKAASMRGRMTADDLMSYGFEALIKAVREFDPTRGVPIGAWITMRVRAGLVEGIRAVEGRHRHTGPVRFVPNAGCCGGWIPLGRPKGYPLERARGRATNTASVGAALETKEEAERVLSMLDDDERKLVERVYWSGRPVNGALARRRDELLAKLREKLATTVAGGGASR